MATRNPRIAFAPSDDVAALLRELSQLTGRTMAWHVGDMLTDLVPLYRGQIEAMRTLKDRPELAREFINEKANEAIATIAQVQLDLDEPKQKPGRKRKARRVSHAET